MTTFWKAMLTAAGIAAIVGASVVWWMHKREAIERKKLSDAAAETRASADQGDVTVESKLAHMYYEGLGVPQDYAEASRWYRKAAEQGYAKAQFNLGDMYFRGKGVPQNYAETVQWIQKAADQGYAKAQAGLGYMYFNGVGLPQDYAEAFRWYSKAADQGEATAQHALGYMYINGVGLPQDYVTAFHWVQKAAVQGDAEAQASLGYMYAKGQGVPQNRTEAYRWYRKAADQGDPNAKHALELLGSGSMTKIRWFELLTALIAIPVGLWASLAFLFPATKFRGWRQASITLLGVSFLSNAGLSLYAFAHYDVQCFPHPYAFHIARFVFSVTAILIVVTVVLPAKKPASGS
jgi:TPR repeat protein